jgi:hypothetical protein
MDDLMFEVMDAAAKANEHTTTRYDPDRQHAAPFGCETALPGNYFKYDDLTSPVKRAATSEVATEAQVGRAIAEIAVYEAEDVDAVDETDLTERMWHGIHEMVWRRWGIGGFAEGAVVRELGGEHPDPDEVAQAKFDCSAAQADQRHGVDIIDTEGETHQVKAKDPDHKPTLADKKDADHLWWMNTDTGELIKMD